MQNEAGHREMCSYGMHLQLDEYISFMMFAPLRYWWHINEIDIFMNLPVAPFTNMV